MTSADGWGDVSTTAHLAERRWRSWGSPATAAHLASVDGVSPQRSTLLAVVAASLTGLGGCGSDDEPEAGPTSCNEVVDGEVTIAAVDLAWEPGCLTGPADEPFTIVVDNRDEGVNHNLHLPDAPDEPSTSLEQGPVMQELEVNLAAGEYEVVCDIHPNMVATLEVAATAEG